MKSKFEKEITNLQLNNLTCLRVQSADKMQSITNQPDYGVLNIGREIPNVHTKAHTYFMLTEFLFFLF